MSRPAPKKIPLVYVPHRGGPWPFVEFSLPKNDLAALARYLRGVPRLCPATPKGIS